MEIFNTLNENKNLSICLGFFDGVHEGHKVVLKNTVNLAKQNGLKSAVITFKDHPLCYLQNRTPQYIVSLEERIKLIETQGIDYAYVLEFDDSIADYLATDYLKEVLVKNFAPRFITTGFNHYFGVNKQGNAELLRNNQKNYNYKFYEIPPITFNNTLISSTKIRQYIGEGNLADIKNLLGYDFYIKAPVIEGKKIGRTISFPTANLKYPKDIIKLPKGVYIAEAEIDGKIFSAVANIGVRPTVSDEKKLLAEIHLLDFNKDIYGKNIKVIFRQKIRNEKKFDSLSELKSRIIEDASIARKFFNS